jgi:putative tricarboxylic transport membrane protein
MVSRAPRWLRAHHDVAVGAALLALCALGYWLTTHFDEVPAMLSQNVPPTFFPRLILTFIVVLSAVLIALGLKRDAEHKEALRPIVLVTAVLIVVAAVAMSTLGALPTLTLLTVALPLIWGERRYVIIGLLALATPVAVYIVFTLALHVRFPQGVLEHFFSR